MHSIMLVSLAGASFSIAFGLVRCVAWHFDQRQAAAVRAITQATMLANAAREVTRA